MPLIVCVFETSTTNCTALSEASDFWLGRLLLGIHPDSKCHALGPSAHIDANIALQVAASLALLPFEFPKHENHQPLLDLPTLNPRVLFCHPSCSRQTFNTSCRLGAFEIGKRTRAARVDPDAAVHDTSIKDGQKLNGSGIYWACEPRFVKWRRRGVNPIRCSFV